MYGLQNMEKRLNRKCDSFLKEFKEKIKDKMLELEFEDAEKSSTLLQFVFDYPQLIITKLDLQKRKRVKNSVPYHERCNALRACGEQCTRRKKNSARFCGTHIKGTPHGEVSSENSKPDTTTTVQVWAQDIKGIIYFIDKDGNVYDPQHIHQNLKNPLVIAKYVKTEDGGYDIPSIF